MVAKKNRLEWSRFFFKFLNQNFIEVIILYQVYNILHLHHDHLL